MGRYTTEAHKWDQSSERSRPRRSPHPSRAAVRLSRQPATKARFSLPSASFRRDPCRRSLPFHFVTACHGSPSRRASALPIASKRRFQSMKREGSAEATLPSLRRAASLVPSLTRPTMEERRTKTERRTMRPSGPTSYFRSRCLAYPSMTCANVFELSSSARFHAEQCRETWRYQAFRDRVGPKWAPQQSSHSAFLSGPAPGSNLRSETHPRGLPHRAQNVAPAAFCDPQAGQKRPPATGAPGAAC